MATRGVRLSHCLWHLLRDYWRRLSACEQRRYQARFGADWAPPRPTVNAFGEVIYDNGAGKDFLWMHRQMIQHARMITCRTGEPDILVWPDLPASDDPTFVPPTSGNFVTYKTHPEKTKKVWDDAIVATARHLRPCVLRRISIETLGTIIEHGIHATMHRRYGALSTAGTLRRPMDNPPAEGSEWDDVSYDSLLDHYSSHVHPWFWGIHTWIDSQITAWERAKQTQVDWRDAWLGGWSRHTHHAHGTDDAQCSGEPLGDNLLLWEKLDEDKLVEAIRSLPLPSQCGLYQPRLTTQQIDEHLRSLGVPSPDEDPDVHEGNIVVPHSRRPPKPAR